MSIIKRETISHALTFNVMKIYSDLTQNSKIVKGCKKLKFST